MELVKHHLPGCVHDARRASLVLAPLSSWRSDLSGLGRNEGSFDPTESPPRPLRHLPRQNWFRVHTLPTGSVSAQPVRKSLLSSHWQRTNQFDRVSGPLRSAQLPG